MYPNLYYAFKDLFGVKLEWLRIFNSFGFFVALAFIVAAVVLSKELKRKERQGLLQSKEETIVVGKPATAGELLLNFLLGFLLGFKIIGLLVSNSPLAKDPQSFIFSKEGSWPIGLGLGLLLAGVKWWEKRKKKLAQPEERKVRIWPHDRVGDLVIFAAVFGFLGAKIFHNLENWDQLMKDPIGSLLSFSGLTFYGGLICAGAAIIYYARKHSIKVWHLADCMAPALMIAYAIGRIGCQVSGDGDWGVLNSAYITAPNSKVVRATPETFKATLAANSNFYLHEEQHDSLAAVPHHSVVAPAFLPNWTVAYAFPHNVINWGEPIPGCDGEHCSQLPIPVFPTAFYETIVCLILFFVLWFMRKRFRYAGQLFGFYLILNGLERFFIEKIRVNTQYNIFGFHPTQAELISSLLVISGTIIMIYLNKKGEPIPTTSTIASAD
jgi:prolipoprotein diacylglyceryltransferase